MDPQEQEDFFAEDERFKTALHYTVGKLSQKAEQDRQERMIFRYGGRSSQCMPVQFSKPFIGTLTEITSEMIGHWAKDLEAFAKHAGRSVINADDVHLLTRRSPSLTKLLDDVVRLKRKSNDNVVDERQNGENKDKSGEQERTENDDEWDTTWILPLPSTSTGSIEAVNRKRRAGATDEFSLANFDDEWWVEREDSAEANHVEASTDQKSPARMVVDDDEWNTDWVLPLPSTSGVQREGNAQKRPRLVDDEFIDPADLNDDW